MWIFIQPNDTLFFRDGRPFDVGADLWNSQIFPPYPPTCYGMVRTLLVYLVSQPFHYKDFFANIPEPFKAVLGDKKSPGTLSIKGPFLGEKADQYHRIAIPAPADLFYKEEERRDKKSFFLLQPDETTSLKDCSDLEIPFHKLGFCQSLDSAELEPAQDVIGHGLDVYLQGEAVQSELKNFYCNDNKAYWCQEQSTIIERSQNLTAEEHKIAYPSYVRMKKADMENEDKGLLVYVEHCGCDIPSIQAVRLGGESRVCFTSQAEVRGFPAPDKLIDRISDTGRFRIILTSPGFFPKNGYYPDFLKVNSNSLPEGEWEICGLKKQVSLVSIAAGRSVRIGGWDLAYGWPKNMIRAVPAGTVLFFKIVNFNKKQDTPWVEALVNSSFPGTLQGGDTQYTREGLNTMMIGGWDYVC